MTTSRPSTSTVRGEQLLKLAAQAAASKKAVDMVGLDLAGLDGVAELLPDLQWYERAAGEGHRRGRRGSAARRRREAVAYRGARVPRRWVLLDFVDVVVHVFHEKTREYYLLERLWGDAREWTLVWNELRQGLARALTAAGIEAGDRLERVELAIPRERSHGDWTTNLAMILAKAAKQPPRAVAEAIAKHFPLEGSPFGGGRGGGARLPQLPLPG
jgi:ribosomal silencing factor RsfS